MKSKKKVFVTVLCAAALVVASVLGTMAYLTSKTDVVTNTFTVGNVQITLDETDVTPMGVKDTDARVQGNEYKLIPGHTYIKDPTVHVAAGSEDSYVFVKVENALANAEAATVEGEYNNIVKQMELNGWTKLDNVANVYYKAVTLPVDSTDSNKKIGVDLKVFDTFKAKSDLTNEQLNAFADKTIEVTAYAIQADGFETPADAWTAGGWN